METIKRHIKEISRYLETKEYRVVAHKALKKVPYRIFRYDNFYILHCNNIRNKKLLRPLGQKYRLLVEDFNYEQLRRIETELPRDLKTVYYRVTDREDKTKVIYIEESGRIIANCFVLFDSKIPSPSGYVLDMKGRVVASSFGIFVDPKYRMKGFHTHLIKAAFDMSKETGNPGLYSEIHYLNRISLISHIKIGFEIYKNIRYIAIFGRKFFREGAPRLWFVPRQRSRR